MKLVLGLMVIASMAPDCDPASLKAAGIQPGDGGVWVGGKDSGVWVTEKDITDRSLPAFPGKDVLCQLVIGNMTGRGKAPMGWQGLWIKDVLRILGKNNGISQRSSDGAQLSYMYRKPGSVPNPDGLEPSINLLLQFEKVNAYADGKRNGSKLVPFEDPYFLISIDAQGLDEAYACWDPALRFAPDSMFVPCEDCAQYGREFDLCSRLGLKTEEDCFREDF